MNKMYLLCFDTFFILDDTALLVVVLSLFSALVSCSLPVWKV